VSSNCHSKFERTFQLTINCYAGVGSANANTLGRANIATQQAVTTESQSSSKPKDDSNNETSSNVYTDQHQTLNSQERTEATNPTNTVQPSEQPLRNDIANPTNAVQANEQQVMAEATHPTNAVQANEPEVPVRDGVANPINVVQANEPSQHEIEVVGERETNENEVEVVGERETNENEVEVVGERRIHRVQEVLNIEELYEEPPLSRYWKRWSEQMVFIRHQVPRRFNYNFFADVNHHVQHERKERALDGALDFILRRIHLENRPRFQAPEPSSQYVYDDRPSALRLGVKYQVMDGNQVFTITQTSYQSKYNEQDMRQLCNALKECHIFDTGFQYMCYNTRITLQHDPMLKCFCPCGKSMRRWREQQGLSNLFGRTQGIEGAPRVLGSICTTNRSGVLNPYSMLLHLRDEIRTTRCPIHTFLLKYYQMTYEYNRVAFPKHVFDFTLQGNHGSGEEIYSDTDEADENLKKKQALGDQKLGMMVNSCCIQNLFHFIDCCVYRLYLFYI